MPKAPKFKVHTVNSVKVTRLLQELLYMHVNLHVHKVRCAKFNYRVIVRGRGSVYRLINIIKGGNSKKGYLARYPWITEKHSRETFSPSTL